MQTTVHLPRNPPDASGLRPYENQVLDRIHGLAVDGVVPLSALTFRDSGQAKAWDKRLRAAVVAEARRAGLSRRRFGPGIIGALVVVSVISSVGVLNAAAGRDGWLHAADDDNPGLAFAMFSLLILTGLSSRSRGERDTAAGRAVAARWLGVRNWLRGHPQFADLPPASVAVWDRYLAYGAAVGVTHLSSAVLDLGMGNRRLVWSSYGGTWHRVRVRYPACSSALPKAAVRCCWCRPWTACRGGWPGGRTSAGSRCPALPTARTPVAHAPPSARATPPSW
jgi:hypothetical protein